jgi:carboxymethylenebutenolidase
MGDLTAHGYLAPADSRVSVVVLHEAYGLSGPRSNIPETCDRLAAAGFRALAPDLYGGRSATSIDDALALMATLRPDRARETVRTAAGVLRAANAGPVAVLGFCMGGALAFSAALELDWELSAAVVFYGTPRGAVWRLRVPVLAHFALHDAFVSLDDIHRVEARLARAGKPVTFHYYDAGHGFMNEKLPAHSPGDAALAWDRTLEFLRAIPA